MLKKLKPRNPKKLPIIICEPSTSKQADLNDLLNSIRYPVKKTKAKKPKKTPIELYQPSKSKQADSNDLLDSIAYPVKNTKPDKPKKPPVELRESSTSKQPDLNDSISSPIQQIKTTKPKETPVIICQPTTPKEPDMAPLPKLGKNYENKVKTLRWLHDTRNDFEVTSETQKTPTETISQEDIELPSVSQHMIKRVYKKSKKKSNILKRAQSFENSDRKDNEPLERRSLACTSPSRIKQCKNLDKLESIKNNMIIEFMEDEVLNVIDKEVSGDAGKKTKVAGKKPTEPRVEIIEMMEEDVLDTIDKEVSVLKSKKNYGGSKSIEKVEYKKRRLEISGDSLSSKEKSWPDINKFKKSLGTTSKAKKSKKSESPKQREQNKENISSNPKIDLDKMEAYFTRVIPKLIERNIPRSSPNNTESKMEYEENYEDDLNDIYIESTQLLSEETQVSKCTESNVLHYAKKLQSLLIPQDQSVVDQNIIDKVFPIIERIFNQLNLQKDKTEPKLGILGLISTFSDKEIQTDSFYREFFNIPSTSALNILHQEVGVQTEDFSVNCHNSNGNIIEKMASLHENTSEESFYSINAGNDLLKKDDVVTNDLAREKVEVLPEKHDEKTLNGSKMVKEVDLNVLPESEMQIEEILEKCRTQNNTLINDKYVEETIETSETACRPNTEMLENRDGDSKNSQLNSSQGSRIICSLPSLKTNVNRKLMFEKAMREREESLKKMPTMDSNDENDFCNRFVNNDISVQFESESQCLNEVVKEKTETLQVPSEYNKIRSNSKSQKIAETQADTQLLNYCEELIEKANKQIVSDTNEVNASPELTTNVDLEKSQKCDKIETQDLLKHCDELIEIANQKNTTGKEESKNNVPSTSNLIEYEEIDEPNDDVGTQALLDHCNALIEKATKSSDKVEAEQDIDDETLCQNLDKLDSDLLNGNKCVPNKFSESLFHEKTQNERLNDKAINDSFDKLCEVITFPSQKRRLSIDDNEPTKRIKILQNVCLDDNPKPDDFNSSDDEMFQNIDVIESTPEKKKHSLFIERLSSSQALRLPMLEDCQIVPPPPGFDDSDENNINVESQVQQIITQMESENIIPNSLSPEKFNILPLKKISNSNSTVSQNAPQGLSQEFKGLSPIRMDEKKNLSVIERAQKSKFSPLTILPKDPPVRSPLTSTPKQKSILKYAKVLPQKKISQEPSQTPISKPCIAFTRLNHSETMAVFSMCNKKLATCEKIFGPQVTHMIVSVDKNNYVKDHTIKLVSAIAAGIWVLNTKWIEQCLGQNVIVDEEPYEVLDSSGIPSPRISRLTRTRNPLFKGFTFYLSPPFANATVLDIQNVIKFLSGTIVSSFRDLMDCPDQICLVLSEVFQSQDYDKFEEILEKYKVATVDMNWLSSCVCRYKILSIKPYILCSDDSLESLGYPAELLVDVPSSIN